MMHILHEFESLRHEPKASVAIQTSAKFLFCASCILYFFYDNDNYKNKYADIGYAGPRKYEIIYSLAEPG